MEFYIGGFAQGKTEYVKTKYPDAYWIDETNYKELIKENNLEIMSDKLVVWNHIHLAIRKEFLDGKNEENVKQLVFDVVCKVKSLVIIGDEIGNGIVPMEKEERFIREETGRIYIELAKQANHVERVICGIAQVIK